MSTNTTSTRRNFLKGGALLAAPLTVTSATAALADGTAQERIRRLEDEAAIRTLHHDWLRQVNAGAHDPHLEAAVRRITADHAGAADRIELAADGQSAVGHFDCTVELATPLPGDSTLVQMAHAQGHGLIRSVERRLLIVGYIKADRSWRIAQVTSG